MKNYNIYTIYNSNLQIRIDKFICKFIKNISRSNIKKLILENNVLINNKNILNPKFILKSKEEIKIFIPICKKNINEIPENIPINILYEDNHIIVINKQSGILVHPGYGNPKGTLINGLLNYYPNLININRFGIIHRLDKNTTGIMIFAKSEISFKILKKLFLLRKIIKEYDAILTGSIISGGLINLPISKDIKNKKKMMINLNGKESITHYRIIKKFDLHTYVKIRPETGRTHQIRVHMSYIGHPLVGDHIYGNNFSNFKKSNYYLNNKNINFNRQALHSSKLIFNHPINNKKLNFNIDLPKDIKNLLENI